MRSVARLKMGYYPLPESEGIKLRGLLEFPTPASVVDPCVGQGTALHLVTSGAEVLRHGIELDAERALAARSKGIEKDSPAVVQAWLTGVNPELGDRVPLRLLRENDIDAVAPAILSAARAFLAGG